MRKKNLIGSVYKVPLETENHVYAHLIGMALFSFYIVGKEDDGDCASIAKKIATAEPIFSTYVHKDVFTNSKWENIGLLPVDKEAKMPVFYKQEVGDWRICWIVQVDGSKKQVTPEECVGVENLAVWDFEQIEERLMDYFMGRKNKAVEFFKVHLSEPQYRIQGRDK